MIKDPRQPSPQRYLRKLYPDPITGKEWVAIKGPDGGVQGVHSASEEAPLKIAGFRLRDASLEAAQKYADWKFIHTPAAKPAAKPGAVPPKAGTPVPPAGLAGPKQ